jgi:hypothetical protein
VHHIQSLVVRVKLFGMEFIFQLTAIGITEMLVWLACVSFVMTVPNSILVKQADF